LGLIGLDDKNKKGQGSSKDRMRVGAKVHCRIAKSKKTY
jgi:hypothetical protein